MRADVVILWNILSVLRIVASRLGIVCWNRILLFHTVQGIVPVSKHSQLISHSKSPHGQIPTEWFSAAKQMAHFFGCNTLSRSAEETFLFKLSRQSVWGVRVTCVRVACVRVACEACLNATAPNEVKYLPISLRYVKCHGYIDFTQWDWFRLTH